MSGPEARIVNGNDDGAVLLGHRGDSIGVVGIGQMLLGVEVSRKNEGFSVPARRSNETTPTIAYRELMASSTPSSQIERRSWQAKASLKLRGDRIVMRQPSGD